MGWVIGALLSVLGSVASNLGVNIQKFSFIRQAARAADKRTSHWKDMFWLSGLGLVILGSLGDFAALSMVAQSIVAPLASTTLVTNVIFAHFWLHEAVGRREIVGTALIILGSTLAVVFGDHEVRSYTNSMLVDLVGGAWFLVYAILVVGLCIAGYLLHKRVTPIKASLVEAIRRYELAVEGNDAQAADWEDEVIARIEGQYKKWVKIHPFALCALSGAFGAQSVLFGKCFAELLSTTMSESNQLFHVFPWLCAICMGLTVSTQLHFLALALNYFDALYVVPVFQCFFISVSTLGGALYFREVYSMSAGEAVAFVFGLLMTLGGVAVLSTRKMSHRKVLEQVAGPGEAGSVWHEGADLPGAESASNGKHRGKHRLVPAEGLPDEEEEEEYKQPDRDAGLLLPGTRRRHSRTGSHGLDSNVRSSPAVSDRGREYEMSDISSVRTGRTTILQPSERLPVLLSSARVGVGFAERAEQEGREFADLRETIGDSQGELAAKLARAGYGGGPMSPAAGTAAGGGGGLTSGVPLLGGTVSTSSTSMSPALAIQIEADQAYINRHGGVGGSASKARRSSTAADVTQQRYEANLNILNQLDAVQEPSVPSTRSNSLDGVGVGSMGMDGVSIGVRCETPRSAYVQGRERRDSLSSRNSPIQRSGSITPTSVSSRTRSLSRASSLADVDDDSIALSISDSTAAAAAAAASSSGTPDKGAHDNRPPSSASSSAKEAVKNIVGDVRELVGDVASALSDPSGSSHMRTGSMVNFAAASSAAAAKLPSAFYSGALIDSAQDLPDVDKDTRLQRLTRLSTVGHWVAGLHAHVPVVGGVAQAILQAKEMKHLMNDQQAQEDKQADRAAAAASASAAASAANSDRSGESSAAGGSSPALGSMPAPASSFSSSSSVFSFPSSSSSSSSHPTSPPTTRAIHFDDDYDPFSTQSTKLLSHRDPFARSANTSGQEEDDSNFLPSPSTAVAAMRPQATASATTAAHAAAPSIDASLKDAGNVLFSPLATTNRHPLQDAFGQPTPSPSPSSDAAAAASLQTSAVEPQPLPSAESAPASVATAVSSVSGAEAMPVEEWAAALRIQSLYRGQVIRRALRSARQSLIGTPTAEQLASILAHPEQGGSAIASDRAQLQAVEPVVPAATSGSDANDLNLM